MPLHVNRLTCIDFSEKGYAVDHSGQIIPSDTQCHPLMRTAGEIDRIEALF